MSAIDPDGSDAGVTGDATVDPLSPSDAGGVVTPGDAGAMGMKDGSVACAEDPNGSAGGPCPCGVSMVDTDLDMVPDCNDKCPLDPLKVGAGECGCGVPEQPGVPCDAALMPEAGCSYASFEGRNYYVCSTARSHSAARALCTKVGLDLVIVDTAAENNFVQQQIGKGKQGWLGLSDARVEGFFRWVDGSVGSYLNFASGEPNSTAEDCVEALGDSGLWNDKSCDVTSPFLCEQVVNKCQASGTEVCDGVDNDCDGSIDLGVCPSGCTALTQESRTYTVCNIERNWPVAREACAALGANLTRVSNANDNALLRLLARSMNRDEVSRAAHLLRPRPLCARRSRPPLGQRARHGLTSQHSPRPRDLSYGERCPFDVGLHGRHGVSRWRCEGWCKQWFDHTWR